MHIVRLSTSTIQLDCDFENYPFGLVRDCSPIELLVLGWTTEQDRPAQMHSFCKAFDDVNLASDKPISTAGSVSNFTSNQVERHPSITLVSNVLLKSQYREAF